MKTENDELVAGGMGGTANERPDKKEDLAVNEQKPASGGG